jgi:hypothetical protein
MEFACTSGVQHFNTGRWRLEQSGVIRAPLSIKNLLAGYQSQHFYRYWHFVDSAALLPLDRHFGRFTSRPRWLSGGSNRHFCRKTHFTKSAEKVPEMRFHALPRIDNQLILIGIVDKGRLPIEPNG